MSEQFTDPHSSHRCPQCRRRVKRVLRTANDKRRWDADDWRRYRCRSDHCDWQGLLPVSERQRKKTGRQTPSSTRVRIGRTMLTLLLAGGLAWVGMQTLPFLVGG